MSGKKDGRRIFLFLQPYEAVGQSFDDGACTEVASTDAGYNYDFAIVTQYLGGSLQVVQVFFGDGRRQVQPSQEIAAFAGTVFECFLCFFYLGFVS